MLLLLSNKDASFVLVIHKDYQQQNEKVDREYKQTKNIGFYPIKMVIIMIMMVVVVVKEFLDNFCSDNNNYYETNKTKKFVKTLAFPLSLSALS